MDRALSEVDSLSAPLENNIICLARRARLARQQKNKDSS